MNATFEPRSRNTIRWRRWFRAAAMTVVLCCLGALGGCHKATEAECEQILDRIVELELKEQGIADPELIKKRTVETKTRKRDQLVQRCVGKRVSQSNMECIRKAQNAAEITDTCLR